MSLRFKVRYEYPIPYPPTSWDARKVRVSYDGLKPGTISTLETVTEELEASPVLSGGKWVYESEEREFVGRASSTHLPTEGLVLELLFYEGEGSVLHDSSGHGNHGEIFGATWGELASGKRYLSFDRVDDYVDTGVGTPASLITIVAWIKVTDVTDYRPIISKDSGVERSFYLSITKGGARLRLLISGDGTNCCYKDSDESIPLNEWVCVAGVFDGTTLRLYKNGVELPGTIYETVPPSLYWGNQKQMIGLNERFSQYFSGDIALAYIYDRALSESEVKRLYEREKQWFE